MKAVMGLDGGGTKTLLRLASLDKEVRLEETGGPSNLCSCGRGPAAENLRALVSRVLARAPERLELQSVCIGAAGILTREDAAFVGEILRAATGCPRVTVMDDAVTALYASLEDAPGLSLTAGTGSICLGKDGRGNLARVGGWGHLFSDEGSAYSMAVQALRRSLWGVDGRGPETRLLDSLLAAWSCAGAEELTAALYREGADKRRLAALSPLVDEAAALGDEVALDILADTARELADMALAAVRRLSLREEAFSVYLSGSVLLKSEQVRQDFERRLIAACPLAAVRPAEKDAAWGAVHLALRHLRA